MPRALPWITNGAAKKEKAMVKKAKPAARHEPGVGSDDDIVNSDLDAMSSKTPEKKKPEKKRFRASSSSPPLTGPPPVETMRPGFAADDIFMMVEDEFLSTAQSYTGHIHQAEYTRLKKLHKSRGQETLAGLGRGTDGRTEQSKALRMKLESMDLAKKQKQAVRKLKGDAGSDSEAEGSEAEDEYMQDPTLSGLMRESQTAHVDLTGLVKPRANTRAAAGYSQSPYKATRTKDVFAEDKQHQQRKPMSKIDEHEDGDGSDSHGLFSGARLNSKARINPAADDDSETDDDDLDAGVPSNPEREAVSAWADKVVAPSRVPSISRTATKVEAHPKSEQRPFAKFARPAEKQWSNKTVVPDLSRARSPKRQSYLQKQESRKDEIKVSQKSVKREPLPSPHSNRPTPPREGYAAKAARRKAERAAADAQRNAIKKEDVDDIPTFLF